MTTGIVIPAHMGSTRFPGKPLADVGGRPLLSYAVEAARDSGLPYYVAYEDREIYRWCNEYKKREPLGDSEVSWVPSISTSDCRNGTERAAKAVASLSSMGLENWDRVIVLQCDEPDVTGEDLRVLADNYWGPCTVQTAMADTDWENENSVAVVAGGEDYSVALRFVRGAASDTREDMDIRRHVGVYLYEGFMLSEYLKYTPTLAEEMHSLEQVRAMALGYAWELMTIPGPLRSINVPADVEKFKEDARLPVSQS